MCYITRRGRCAPSASCRSLRDLSFNGRCAPWFQRSFQLLVSVGDCVPWFQRSLTAASSIALILLRLHICHAHDVGKHTGSGDGGPRTVALNQHRIFVVAFCGKQDDIV